MLVFSDGCCPWIDWYQYGEKEQGLFILQAEKVNGNCYYVLERGEYPFGIWKCEDSWWIEYMIQSSDKGQCKDRWYHASTDSNPNLGVQDNSLQWILFDEFEADLKFNCVDLCL